MGFRSLVPLIVLVVVVCILAFVGFVAYSIAHDVGKTTREKMEKKNFVFSKDGMKIGVKEVNEEAEKDSHQRCVIPTSSRLIYASARPNAY